MAHAPITHLRARERRKKIAKIVAFAIVTLGIVGTGGVAFLSHVDFFELQKVLISGTKVIEPTDLETAVWDEMQGNYGLLFSKRNTFIFPKRSISASVLDAFPRLRDAKVEFADYHTIRLTVEERNPVALWCTEGASSTPCYFLDEHGLVFDEAPQFSSGLYVRFFGNLTSAGENPIRGEFIPSRFEGMQNFLRNLEARGWKSVSVVVAENDDVEITADSGARLLFVLPEAYAELLRDFDLIMLTLESKQIPKSSLATIDMRFPGRAFYTLRAQE